MINIKEYVIPKSVEEAYQYLNSKKGATLIGGGAFIRMGSKNISLAIDLSRAGLSDINEGETSFEIGAMATFGDIEQNKALSNHFNNLLANSVKDIVGIQLRNLVTIGATVYSRYGFSDPITALLVLDTKVKLFKQGIIPLRDFLTNGSQEKDILERVIIQKDQRQCSFKSMRNSKGDYAILNLAIAKKNNEFTIAVGARPNRGILATETMEYLSNSPISEKRINEGCDILVREMEFGTNTRGSEGYRREISKVLLKRGLREVDDYETKFKD